MSKPKKCKETIDETIVNNKKELKKEKVIVEESGLKRYWFPKQGKSVMAKSLKEAEKKIKAMTGFKNKAI